MTLKNKVKIISLIVLIFASIFVLSGCFLSEMFSAMFVSNSTKEKYKQQIEAHFNEKYGQEFKVTELKITGNEAATPIGLSVYGKIYPIQYPELVVIYTDSYKDVKEGNIDLTERFQERYLIMQYKKYLKSILSDMENIELTGSSFSADEWYKEQGSYGRTIELDEFLNSKDEKGDLSIYARLYKEDDETHLLTDENLKTMYAVIQRLLEDKKMVFEPVKIRFLVYQHYVRNQSNDDLYEIQIEDIGEIQSYQDIRKYAKKGWAWEKGLVNE